MRALHGLGLSSIECDLGPQEWDTPTSQRGVLAMQRRWWCELSQSLPKKQLGRWLITLCVSRDIMITYLSIGEPPILIRQFVCDF